MSNPGVGETFADLAAKQVFVVRLVAAARDQPLHRIKELQPVFERRLGDGLPVVETFRPVKKLPFALHLLNIHLQLCAILGHTLPADFCFGGHKLFFGQIHARHGHRGDAFLAADETH